MKAEFSVNLFHEATLRSLEIWTAGPRESAVARAFFILSAYAETPEPAVESSSNGIIREYDLGLAPRIRDTRTGRETTRVNQVLKGELETLLP